MIIVKHIEVTEIADDEARALLYDGANIGGDNLVTFELRDPFRTNPDIVAYLKRIQGCGRLLLERLRECAQTEARIEETRGLLDRTRRELDNLNYAINTASFWARLRYLFGGGKKCLIEQQ